MFHHQNRRTSGFTLVELAIVLGVAGVLFGGLWRLLSTSNQQMRDQATAAQHTQLIAAVSAYLQSSGTLINDPTGTGGGQAFLAAIAKNGTAVLTLPTVGAPAASGGVDLTNCAAAIPANAGLCSFLPAGFNVNTTNPYGQTYSIRVLKDGSDPGMIPATYSFMIMTVSAAGTNLISDTSGGRISAMIGGDGGFIYSTDVCGAHATFVCGSYGAWSAQPTTVASPTYYGFGAMAVGHIASRTFYSSTQNVDQFWLARKWISTDNAIIGGGNSPVYNTMLTPLFLGDQPVYFGATSPMGAGAADTMYLGATGTISGSTGAGGITGNSGGSMILRGNAKGTVDNIRGNPILQLNETSGCAPAADPSTGAVDTKLCNYTVTVVGSMSVTGFLYADTFYSPSFGYFSSSDRRLKTNIMPLSNSLAKVSEIKPVSFSYKANGKEGLGVIAQDLEKIYPQLVSDGPDGFKAVAYNGLIAPLIGAVQELKKENEDLRAQLRKQEENQKTIIEKLEKLQKR